MLTPDHHLDDRLSLSHVSRRRRRWRRRCNKRCSHMNGTTTHQWIWRIWRIWRKSPKLRRRQIVQITILLPPIWRPVKISPPKVEKPTYGTKLYHPANFHADQREISVPGQKKTCFLIGDFDSLWATVSCYTFLESSRRANFTPHLTYNAATYRFRDIKIWDFGAPWGTPKGETLGPETISTIVQNFTPINVTVAEISVTEPNRWKYIQNYSRKF